MSGLSPSSRGLDHQTKRLLDGLKKTLEQGDGQTRDKSKRWIREEDLSDPNLLKLINGYAPNLSSGNVGINNPPNLTIPPAPTGLAVSGGFSHILIKWDAPDTLYNNHGFATVYRNTTDNIANAIEIHQTVGFIYADLDVDRGETYFYWIRFTSAADIQGPPNSSTGTAGSVSLDPTYVLDVISGEILESDLAASLQTEIGRIDVNAGLVANAVLSIQTLRGEYEDNVSAVQTKIGVLADPNHSVAEAIQVVQTVAGDNQLSISNQATSIDGLNGSYSVKIDNNGHVSGYGLASTTNDFDGSVHSTMLFSVDSFGIAASGATTLAFGVDTSTGTVVMDGAYILDATITDAKIGSLAVDKLTGVTSTFLLSNIGVGNITNAYIGNIIQSTNYVAGVSGWSINKNGFVEFGSGIFRGDLDGANGTFSGTLTADAVNAVNTINIAGDAITLVEQILDPSISRVNATNSNDGFSIPNLYSFTVDFSDFSDGQKVVFHQLIAKFVLSFSRSAGYRSDGVPTLQLFANDILVAEQSSFGVQRTEFALAGSQDSRERDLTIDLSNAVFEVPNSLVTFRFSFYSFLTGGDWDYVEKTDLKILFQGGKR